MEFGTNKSLNILLLSSSTPLSSASRMAIDIMKAFEKNGHNIDLITKYDEPGLTRNMIPVISKAKIKTNKTINSILKIKNAINNAIIGLKSMIYNKKRHQPGYYFIDLDETKPAINPLLILDKISKPYDLIILFSSHEMITSKTLLDIYNKTKAPIFILSPDMYPFTGGCHYFWDCRNFEISCGKCPGLFSHSKNDISHKNYLYKKKIFNQIEYIFLGNTYMNNFALKSNIFKDSFISKMYVVVNEEEFKPKDKLKVRNQYKISDTKEFVIFSGANSLKESRKGFSILVEAVNLFTSKLSIKEKEKIALVLAGKTDSSLKNLFDIDVYEFGYLNFEKLADTYSLSDVFLCPTILDAGPMMVNQSLSCGTPVVAFELGTAIDVIKNQNTGYCAKYKDVYDFSYGIEYIYNLSELDRKNMSYRCREIALKTTSFKSFVSRIEELYYNGTWKK